MNDLWKSGPRGAINTLRTYVMRLRKALGAQGAERIETREPGYLARLEPDELDLALFNTLSAQTEAAVRQDGSWEKAASSATAALALWRESPLIDVPSQVLHDEWLPLLELRHLQVLEWRIEADLMTGGTDALIPEVSALIKRHPLRESLYRLLMMSLARADRAGEALAVYREARSVLIDQLGVEPGTEVQRLHRAILAGETPPLPTAHPGAALKQPARTGPASPPTRRESAQSREIPRQLPADTRMFTGRETELARVMALAARAHAGTAAGMVLISALDGMGGVGKTALAVHAAHRLAGEFPDGQLYVDLRGHTPGLDPLPPEDALEYLLRSVGVPADRISGDLAARAALYRTHIADTRTLIILDNAATAAQVRPLLPGRVGSFVLVTSRRRLDGLEDAHPLTLGALSDAEAVALLDKVAGVGRLEPGHAAVGELIQLCGHLPLALRIVGARLRRHRAERIENLVERLREEGGRLTGLRDEDRDLAAVFNSSYAELSRQEQELYRALSLVPGTDADAPATAALLGVDAREAGRLLESLLEHSMLLEHTPGRYRFHDLVRIHAAQLAEKDDGPAHRDDALERLCQWYLGTAHAASRLINPHRTEIVVRPGSIEPLSFASQDAALAWCDIERGNLVAAIHSRTRHAPGPFGWQLPVVLAPYFNQRKQWSEWIATHEAGLRSARQSADKYGEARIQVGLGRAYTDLREFDKAESYYNAAAALYRESGHQRELLRVLANLASLANQRGWARKAYEANTEALALARTLGDPHAEGVVLGNLGAGCGSLGMFDEAVEHMRRALAIREALGDRYGQAMNLQNLAEALRELGRPQESAEHCSRALKIQREDGNRYGEATTLLYLGLLERDQNRPDAARGHWESAYSIFEELGSPRVAEIDALLSSL